MTSSLLESGGLQNPLAITLRYTNFIEGNITVDGSWTLGKNPQSIII